MTPHPVTPPQPGPVLTIHVWQGRRGLDFASATLNGQHYETSSRKGAVFKLCRLLVPTGAPDTPYQAVGRDSGAVRFTGPSWWRLAALTVIENEHTGPRFAPFRDQPEDLGQRTAATVPSSDTVESLGAVEAVPGMVLPARDLKPVSDSTVCQAVDTVAGLALSDFPYPSQIGLGQPVALPGGG